MIEQNYFIFNKYYPKWIEKINEVDISSDYKIDKAKSGDVILGSKKNDKYISYHSKYNPVREAESLIKTTIPKEPQILVIAGFALGYLVEAALSIFKSCKVIIFDFDWVVLKIALENRNLSKIFTNPRIHFVFDSSPQTLIDYIKEFKTSNIGFIVHKPSKQMYPDFYDKLVEAIRNFNNSKGINIATLNRFQRLWSRNILKNIIPFILYKGVNITFDKYRHPCVIVAAGPSLNKNINLLKKVKGKAIIIAVDTALQVLQYYGIEPDFAIAIDPQYVNKKYFENLKDSNTVLVCESSISPNIFNAYSNKKLILGSAFHLVKWLEGFTGEKGEIEIGGSVVTAAYGLAKKMGCNPIVFIGLDLAYSDNQTHLKGTYFEENCFYLSTRFKNINYFNWNLLEKSNTFNVKGYNNQYVKSDRKFYMFQKWLESKFAETDQTVIDATEGGAVKKNCITMSFEKVIDKYFKHSNFNIDIDNTNCDNINLTELLKALDEVIITFSGLKKKVEYGKNLAKELYDVILKSITHKKPYPKRVKEINCKLNEIDKLITKDNTINGLISITIQSIIHDIDSDKDSQLNKQEKENNELKTAKRSISLYEHILSGIDFNIAELKKALNRVSVLNKTV